MHLTSQRLVFSEDRVVLSTVASSSHDDDGLPILPGGPGRSGPGQRGYRTSLLTSVGRVPKTASTPRPATASYRQNSLCETEAGSFGIGDGAQAQLYS
jgi:hypothetical protein